MTWLLTVIHSEQFHRNYFFFPQLHYTLSLRGRKHSFFGEETGACDRVSCEHWGPPSWLHCTVRMSLIINKWLNSIKIKLMMSLGKMWINLKVLLQNTKTVSLYPCVPAPWWAFKPTVCQNEQVFGHSDAVWRGPAAHSSRSSTGGFHPKQEICPPLLPVV